MLQYCYFVILHVYGICTQQLSSQSAKSVILTVKDHVTPAESGFLVFRVRFSAVRRLIIIAGAKSYTVRKVFKLFLNCGYETRDMRSALAYEAVLVIGLSCSAFPDQRRLMRIAYRTLTWQI